MTYLPLILMFCLFCLLVWVVIWLVFFRRRAASDQQIMSVAEALRARLLPPAGAESDAERHVRERDLSRYRSGTLALAQPLPPSGIVDFFEQTDTTDLARDALRDMHMGRLLNLLLFYALVRGRIKGLRTSGKDRALFDLLARHGLLTPDNHTLVHDKVIRTALRSFFHPRGDRRFLIPWIAQHHADDFHQALQLRNAEVLAAIIERFDARHLPPPDMAATPSGTGTPGEADLSDMADKFERHEARRTHDWRILYNLPPERLRNGKPTGFWLLAVEPVRLFYMIHGRARRKEYWGFTLFIFLFGVVVELLDKLLQLGIVPYTVLLWLVPSISVNFRRMHDIGRSGWWSFVPVISFIFACIPGLPEANMYGPNPKA